MVAKQHSSKLKRIFLIVMAALEKPSPSMGRALHTPAFTG
jgi:hypothetical protein